MTRRTPVDGAKGRATRIDRRQLLRAAGGTLGVGAGAVSFRESRAAAKGRWDHEADLVVVGTGAAGLSAAVMAMEGGASAILLDAGPLPGGTTARSGGGMWIPNNRHMRARGFPDPREDAIRYVARYGYPELYDPSSPTLGLAQNSYELVCALYDHASPAIDAFERLGALSTRGDGAYDYFDHAPENKAPRGRLVLMKFPDEAPGKPGARHAATAVTPEWYSLDSNAPSPQGAAGGAEMVRQFKSFLDARGAKFLTEHRVTRLITNSKGEVIGLEATTDEGATTVAIRARKAVHLASGGFTLNPDLRRSFQRGPVFGACAPPTNQGDAVYMATSIGAKLGNMQNAWHHQYVLDQVVEAPSSAVDLFFLPGDSMFMVNKFGRRVVNEKRPYSDRSEVHYVFDPNNMEWSNLVLFLIFDQRTMDLCAGRFPYPPKGTVVDYVVKGKTIDELRQAVAARLAQFTHQIGGFQLDDSFASNLSDTISRFNKFAETGIDEDFQRGKFRYDQQWHELSNSKAANAADSKLNLTMYPMSSAGPFYAMLVVKGQTDTNGGPVVNARAQVLSAKDQPIPGLYGAGNCIAAPTGRAALGGGNTLGPALTFGYIAGINIVKEAVKQEV